MEKVKGLSSTDGWVQNGHGDVKHSIGDTGNSAVVTVSTGRWVQDCQEGPSVSHVNVQPLCCIPETNTVLNVNCN